MKTHLQARDALIIVDVQADFLPGGALAVPGGDRVIAPLNRYIERFAAAGLAVVFTRDWHPPAHCSFRDSGGAWPPHCIADTPGARLSAALALPKEKLFTVSKGTNETLEAYSGFHYTELQTLLQARAIERLFVGGLATEFCVKSTVLDALALGYTTFLLVDGIQGIDVAPGDCDRALAEMLRGGAKAMTLSDLAAEP